MPDPRRFQVIRGGRILSLPTHRGEPADVLLEGDTIRAVGPPGLAAPPDAEVIDARDRLLLPGLVNAHTHAHGALGKGLAGDRWSLELLLNANPTITAERTLEDKRLCAMLSAVEMVRKGSTACFDLFVEFPVPSVDGVLAVAEGYREVGLRAVVAPMISDTHPLCRHPRPAGRVSGSGARAAPPHPGRAHRDQPGRLPRDSPALALRPLPAPSRPRPTIPLHCSDELLTGCRDLAREWQRAAPDPPRGVEGPGAGRPRRAMAGASPPTSMSLGLLGPGFSAAHAIWIDADDIRRLADRGAAVAHNPLEQSSPRLGHRARSRAPRRRRPDGDRHRRRQYVGFAKRVRGAPARRLSLPRPHRRSA